MVSVCSRAAAVLADLVRLPEGKAEIARCGGLEPFVAILSSSCAEARQHAACALWRGYLERLCAVLRFHQLLVSDDMAPSDHVPD